MAVSVSSYAQTFRNDSYGGVQITLVSARSDRNIYRVQSNQFPSHLFSQVDVDDYAFRVNRRNCSDPDVMYTLRSGVVFQYDFYGSDGVKVRSFYTTANVCRLQQGAR